MLGISVILELTIVAINLVAATIVTMMLVGVEVVVVTRLGSDNEITVLVLICNLGMKYYFYRVLIFFFL